MNSEGAALGGFAFVWTVRVIRGGGIGWGRGAVMGIWAGEGCTCGIGSGGGGMVERDDGNSGLKSSPSFDVGSSIEDDVDVCTSA
jgi:hypothetical protein